VGPTTALKQEVLHHIGPDQYWMPGLEVKRAVSLYSHFQNDIPAKAKEKMPGFFCVENAAGVCLKELLVWWLVHINNGYAEAKTLCN